MRAQGGPATGAIPPRLHLQEARIMHQLSQEQVAEHIGTTNVNVSRWERGITKPHPYFIERLCRLFGKQAWELDLAVRPRASDGLPAQWSIHDPSIPVHPPRPFVGRNNELSSLRTRICASAQGSVVALYGMPSVGKTTLAWALTHSPHIQRFFSGGILWVTLGPKPDRPQLLKRWGELLGVPAATMERLDNRWEWIGTLRNAIGTRRMLLVIDDAWSWDDADLFRVGGPNCAHVVLTRFKAVAVSAATPPALPIQVRDLGDADSLKLLQCLAPETAPCAQGEMRSFVRSVGGLPLALKQAGCYLHRIAAAEGIGAMRAALRRLGEPGLLLELNELPESGDQQPGLPASNAPTLASAIGSMCQSLSLQASAALALLATLPPRPHTFTENVAVATARCSLDVIDELLDAGLLEPCFPDSYTLHPLIGAYARVFLAQEG